MLRQERSGFDDDKRRQSTRVVPRLRRALLIGNMIDRKDIAPAALAESLDMLSPGIFLVDAAGRIIHANLSGRIMLSEADVVSGLTGALGAIDPQANQALLDAFTAASRNDPAPGRKGISVLLAAHDGRRYVANVVPLTSDARREVGVSDAAAATVFVQKSALDLASLPEVIAKEYGLSPAELRVLFAIIEIGGVRKAAKALGTSETDVKAHLQQLFKKTGTTHEAGLVKLAAGYFHALLG